MTLFFDDDDDGYGNARQGFSQTGFTWKPGPMFGNADNPGGNFNSSALSGSGISGFGPGSTGLDGIKTSAESYYHPQSSGPLAGWSDHALDNFKQSIGLKDYGLFLQDRIGTYAANRMSGGGAPAEFKLDYNPVDYGVPRALALAANGETGQGYSQGVVQSPSASETMGSDSTGHTNGFPPQPAWPKQPPWWTVSGAPGVIMKPDGTTARTTPSPSIGGPGSLDESGGWRYPRPDGEPDASGESQPNQDEQGPEGSQQPPKPSGPRVRIGDPGDPESSTKLPAPLVKLKAQDLPWIAGILFFLARGNVPAALATAALATGSKIITNAEKPLKK
jgi:hypothetical protein